MLLALKWNGLNGCCLYCSLTTPLPIPLQDTPWSSSSMAMNPAVPQTSHSSTPVVRPLSNQSAQEFIQKLKVHWTLARDSLAWAISSQAWAHDSWCQSDEFEVGDEVLVNPHSLDLVDVKGTGHKLLQWRISPFLISEKISPVVYQLHLPVELHMHPIINIEHISKYHWDEKDGWTKLGDLQALKGDDEYEVDQITGHRYNWTLQHMEYLVRWKGYGLEHDMFEPESHLRNTFLRLRSYKSKLCSEVPEFRKLA